ncbi:energy transducer TonB [uncultured Kordia sp.]|uniref:energy transducer TonB n=1 Tax=uncultured Kordia sp. TaxID=507699 RepID=UPI00261DA6E9|nr:energy transducer TonB [uncultured Kordia sp.]
MSIFNTEHKRKSATITTVLMVILLLLMFVFGMKYMNPPEESGIAVNFGTTDTGKGQVETQKNPKPVAKSQQEEVEQPQETEPVEETQPDTSAAEEVVTQDSEEAIAIKKAEEEKKRKADEDAKKKAEADRIAKAKAEAEAKKKAEEAKKKADFEALTKDLNSEGGTGSDDGEGEGPNDGDGNKGNPDGDPYATSYYGAPGTGGGGAGGYGLNGRSKLSGGNVDKQDCNEAGRVVVKITVNRAGKVIDAVAGVKGTTNSAKCLLKPAEKAAYEYRWNKDSKAPTTQVGFIVVNFKLGQ